MSAHGFRSLFMAASVAGAALGCYLVSLNVASERAKLENVEEKIVLTQRDIRVLQTEIGTRGRLAQLERWNVKFIRLSAPSADQFVEGGFQLASMVAPQRKPAVDAPVILAAAPAKTNPVLTDDAADAPPPSVAKGAEPKDLMHTVSYTKAEPLAAAPAKPTATKLALTKPVTAKPAKKASSDPLAPLPAGKAAPNGGASKKSPVAAKDDGTAQ